MRFQPRDLPIPVVLAPLAGGPSTPRLAAAVSNAGGLGFLGLGYRSAQDAAAEVRATRALTDRPFGVNLFVPGDPAADEGALHAYAGALAAEAKRYNVDVGDARWDDDGWDAKLALLLAEPVPVVSFTFGCPDAAVIESLQEAGTAVWVTITEVAEATLAASAGADALVVQGVEAGGHRGSFVDRDLVGQVGLLPLLRLVAAITDLPMVAAGGIGDGSAVAAVLAAGADAAQLGTAFLRASEAGTSAAHRAALARPGVTRLTRAFTGRQARGIVNRFLSDHHDHAITAYPQVHHLTAPLRAAARQADDPDGINLWAGQAFTLSQDVDAADLVRRLSEECATALVRANRRGPAAPG